MHAVVPVVGASLGVGDRDDDELLVLRRDDHLERKALQHEGLDGHPEAGNVGPTIREGRRLLELLADMLNEAPAVSATLALDEDSGRPKLFDGVRVPSH